MKVTPLPENTRIIIVLVLGCLLASKAICCRALSTKISHKSDIFNNNNNNNSMPRTTSHKTIVKRLINLAQTELEKKQDPAKAKYMQGYCKTTMPMYGLQKPDRAVIEKSMHASLADENIEVTPSLYRDCVQSLWELPHREEKYLAIDFALKYQKMIDWEQLDLYEGILRDSHDIMWWDFVDPIAINLVGRVALIEKEKIEPRLRQWIDDEDHMWLRRAAILAQLKHKKETDEDLLLEFCRKRMHEKEFFIRKAIGWVLREYGKTNPDLVVHFLTNEKANLSALSYREGSRILVKQGHMN